MNGMRSESVWKWMHTLGGPGLILLGIADNTPFISAPPGSVDVFVILLSAHRHEWWVYYAFMATVGEVLGGYLAYRLAEKGGQETLEENRENARRKIIQALRKARVHHGVPRFYPAAAVSFQFCPDGCGDHAVSLQAVSLRFDGGSRPAFLCRGLFGQDLWPANDRLLLAALPVNGASPCRSDCNFWHRRPRLLQVVSTYGTTSRTRAG